MLGFLRLVVPLAVLMAPAASAYVQFTVNGVALRRADVSNVQFLLNTSAAAGLTNSQGQPFITPDSDPAGAIQAALSEWNAVSSSRARFAPLGNTTAVNDTQDNKNVFVFRDTPEIRSFVGASAAKTIYSASADGQIIETDIVFNPTLTFSTTGAPGTYDLQSVATHELGHALGADHSGVLGATMFWSTSPGEITQRRLSADDIAFVSALYPASGGNGYGTIAGRLAATSGAALRGGFVTAIDADQGFVVDGLSNSTGNYSFQVPPGNYVVYAEPLADDAQLFRLNLATTQVDATFLPSFYGGADHPAKLSIDARSVASADIVAPPGPSPTQVQYSALLPVGRGGTFTLLPGPEKVVSGQSSDLLLFGPGIDGSLNDSTIRVLGPAAIRPGSVRLDSATVNGSPVVRLTLDVPARSNTAIATLVITKGSDVSVSTGLLVLTAPKPAFTAESTVNAASFAGGGVAPGEILTIFGTNVGPATPASNTGFDASGALPTTLGGVSVSFGGVLAPLFYVAPGQINLQVPYEVANSATVAVTVQVGSSTSDPISVPVVPASPGIFQIPGSGQGIVVNQDGSINSPAAPAPKGTVVTIYATGQGVVSPAAQTGKAAGSSPLSGASGVTATVGGMPATVLFGGLSPGFVGLLQVNATVPANAPSGSVVPLQVTVRSVASQANVTIAVQ